MRPIAWGDYASRLLTSFLLFGTSFALLAESPFAQRMRNDIPLTVNGLDGPQSLAFVVAFVLAVIPLLAGPAFLRALLVSGWMATGIGAYWWTTIPWDELITESNFPMQGVAPGFWDYAFVAGPAIIATLHVVLARVSRVRKECKERGVDADETSRAAATAFLAGAAALAVSLALSGALWALLASGALQALAGVVPRGVPALALCAGLAGFAWLVAARKVRLPKLRVGAVEKPAASARAKRAES